MIELNDVTKSFAGNAAVRKIGLTIPASQTTVLIGPSGCGKSTLLRLIIGLLTPDSGEIRIGNRPLGPQTMRDHRLTTGYVIQDGGLFPHLTALQNITLMAQHLGRAGAWIRNRVEELTALTHLGPELLDRYPIELSGGQRQRVGLMRALMLDPNALLLDEPLAALDPMVRAQLQEDLRQIFTELNKTVVLVTHDMGEAGYFGDQIVLMKEGEIVQCGSFDQLVHQPADPFVTQFINAQRTPPAKHGELS